MNTSKHSCQHSRFIWITVYVLYTDGYLSHQPHLAELLSTKHTLNVVNRPQTSCFIMWDSN